MFPLNIMVEHCVNLCLNWVNLCCYICTYIHSVIYFSFTEIQKIKKKKHSIKKHSIAVEIKHIQASVDSQQPTAVDTAQSHSPTSSDGNDLSEPVVPDLIEVSGLHPQADEDVIMNYFHGAKSGGAKGTVTECKLMGSGVARIRFSSPESEYAYY